MRKLLLIAALTMGGSAIAQTGPINRPIQPGTNAGPVSGMDPDGRQGVMTNRPGIPPGDGIDMHGHDPEGQAFTPLGFNTGIGPAVYPPVTMAPPALIGGNYPPCSPQVTDRCVQTYVEFRRSSPRRRGRR